jgi:hypothetical protein
VSRSLPDLVVTNTGQPQVVQIDPVSRSAVAQGVTPQLAANVTVTIAPVNA